MDDSSIELMQEVEAFYWWWRVRRDLLKQLVGALIKPEERIKILDIGCGVGNFSKILEKYGDVYSVDSSPAAVKFCQEKMLKNVFLGRVESLPFADKTFDLIVALDVLEHVAEDNLAVTEIGRVLKKDGYFISFVPALMSLWSEHDVNLFHYRRYNKNTFLALFKDGWQVKKVSFFNFFLFPFIFLWRQILKILGYKQKRGEVDRFSFLNGVFYWIFRAELPFLKLCSFPFGVSLLGVFRKR